MSQRVYRVSRIWRAFFVLGGLGLVALMVFGLHETLNDPAAGATQLNTVIVLLCAFVALSLACVLFGFRGALVLDQDGLRYRSLGRWREFRFGELSGFRIPPKEARSLCILFGKDGRRAATIPGVFERPAEILSALAARLPDLDLSQARAESQALERERDLAVRSGRVPADIRPVRLLCRVLNALALAALVAVLFRPSRLGKELELAVVAVAVLVAPAAWVLKHRHPGVVRFESRRGSELPSVEFALIGGLIAPVVPAVRDYAVLDVTAPLIWGGILALCTGLGLVRTDPQIGKRKVVVALLLAACFAWGYGAIGSLNGALDTGAVRALPTRVVRKSASEHTDSVVVAPFGSETGETSVDVSRKVYDAVSPGDAVFVIVRPGAFGLPWISGLQQAAPGGSAGS
jgi:hypothetical protein